MSVIEGRLQMVNEKMQVKGREIEPGDFLRVPADATIYQVARAGDLLVARGYDDEWGRRVSFPVAHYLGQRVKVEPGAKGNA